MPNRARRHVWSHRGALVAGATLLVIGAARGAAPDAAKSSPVLADPGGLLTTQQRAALVRSLRAKAVESGSPLSILLVPRLAHHETIAELAGRTFSADGLDAPGPPRVLLAVSAHDRQAAIETGQGVAGIVPEIDAQRIVARLQSDLARQHLVAGLDQAVAAIAASARATAERRRPAPPEPASPDVTVPAPDRKAVAPKPDAPPAPGTTATGHSLMPAAYAVAAIVVLGLALRRRRRNGEERVGQIQRPAPKPKQGRDVKSIGDRPMS